MTAETTTKSSPIPLEDVIEQLSTSLSKELLQGNSIKQPKSNKKKDIANVVVEHADRKGLKLFYDTLSKDLLKAGLEAAGHEVTHSNKGKMLSEFKAALEAKDSFEDFLGEFPQDLVEQFCAAQGFQTEGSKEEMVEALLEEVTISGATDLLDSMTKEFIIECAQELKLKTTGSKEQLINRILGLSFPNLKDVPSKPAPKVELDKKPIVKGITRDDLINGYYLPELKEYCKTNGLKVSGTRKDLIKRILESFKEKDETEGEGEKKKKRRKRVDWKPPSFKGKPGKGVKASTKKRKRPEGEEGEGEPAQKKQKTSKTTAKDTSAKETKEAAKPKAKETAKTTKKK